MTPFQGALLIFALVFSLLTGVTAWKDNRNTNARIDGVVERIDRIEAGVPAAPRTDAEGDPLPIIRRYGKVRSQ